MISLGQAVAINVGGRGGIRTHGTLAGTPVFKTGALNHSATLPMLRHQPLSSRKIKNGREQKWFWPQLGPKTHYITLGPDKIGRECLDSIPGSRGAVNSK